MANRDRSGTHPHVPTSPLTGVNAPSPAPWYAHVATTAGRPVVLAATLIMSMPGEYHVARLAGWTDPWAYGMPLSLSAYAGIAAVVSATRPKGARGRVSAICGAAMAICLALAAQVVAHLVTTQHMAGDQAWLIAVTSTIPPAVLAHLLHLAATPTGVTPAVAPLAMPVAEPVTAEVTRADAPVTAPPVQPQTPVIPPQPAQAPAIAPPTAATPAPTARTPYTNPSHEAIRRLYDTGNRPTTSQMRAAITAAGQPAVSDGGARMMRQIIEAVEPELATYPAPAPALAVI
jgi:hypothetical protein